MSKPVHPVIQWLITGTKSNILKCDGNQLVGFITPATFSSTAITFEMTATMTSPIWVPVKDSGGSAISFTVTTSSYYGFSQDQIAKFNGVEVFRFVGGSSETAGTLIQPILIPRPY